MSFRFRHLFIAFCLIGIMLTGCGIDELLDDTDGNIILSDEIAAGHYVFRALDESELGIEGVTLQICSDTKCQLLTTDKYGTVVFEGDPQAYEVHIQDYPTKYYFDTDMVYITAKEPEIVKIVFKDAGSNSNSQSENVSGNEGNENSSGNEDNESAVEAENADDNSNSGESESTSGADGAENTETVEEYKFDASVFPYTEKLVDIEPSSKKISFSGTDMNGNAIDESYLADYDVILINIWEPWCSPCVSEMAYFDDAVEAAQRDGIKFTIIGFYSTKENAANIVEKLGLSYPVVMDKGFFNDFATGYVPTNFFVNKDGYVLPITLEEMTAIYSPYGYDANDLKEYIYKNGQTNTLEEEVLYQLIADRL